MNISMNLLTHLIENAERKLTGLNYYGRVVNYTVTNFEGKFYVINLNTNTVVKVCVREQTVNNYISKNFLDDVTAVTTEGTFVNSDFKTQCRVYVNGNKWASITNADTFGYRVYFNCNAQYFETIEQAHNYLVTNGYAYTYTVQPQEGTHNVAYTELVKEEEVAPVATPQTNNEEQPTAVTIEEVKAIIKKLDEYTGLNACGLKIVLNSRLKRALGRCIYKKVMFGATPLRLEFSLDLLNCGNIEVIKDVVIHEYAHYWQLELTGVTSHNNQFKELCQELGGTGETTCTAEIKRFYKHEVVCEDCGSIFKYRTTSQAVKDIVKGKKNYKCNCGSDNLKLL